MTKKKEPMLIPFHRPHLDVEDRNALKRVLYSNWLTTGREASLFEHEFGEAIGSPNCVAVSSCTAALHLALVLAGIGQSQYEELVVVPTLTFTATAAAVVMAGARPVLADVDPETLTLSRASIEDAGPIRNIRAVMPVHYGGNPSRFGEVLAWAEQNEVQVIDDAAHALPATWNGHRIGHAIHGAFATCFSFYPTKPITTAEGGMLVLRDTSQLERARRLTLHGIDADAYQRSRQSVYHYEVTEHGWKYNLPDLLASLGRSQLHKMDELGRRRQYIAQQYSARFQKLRAGGLVKLPLVQDNYSSAWHLYVIQFELERLRADWTRDRISVALREKGIGTSVHYRPLHRHSYWKQFCYGSVDQQSINSYFPHAERAYAQMLSLPIWPGMTEENVDYVVDEIEAILEVAKL